MVKSATLMTVTTISYILIFNLVSQMVEGGFYYFSFLIQNLSFFSLFEFANFFLDPSYSKKKKNITNCAFKLKNQSERIK